MALKRDIEGTTWGYWNITEYLGDCHYKLVCSVCGAEKSVRSDRLAEGKKPIQCVHEKREDLTNKQFGNLIVLDYAGNKKWRCQCQCENKTIVVIPKQRLIRGYTKSCGCMSAELGKKTILDKYGETNVSKIKNPREQWQVDAVSDKQKLYSYIMSLGYKPTIKELCDLLKLNRTNMLLKVHEYELEDTVDIGVSTTSESERELAELVESYGLNVIRNSKKLIENREIDIYIPEKNIAIEFNGSYWHSDELKDKYYHQQKTIECAKKNIRLIHVFEYEWLDNIKRNIIEQIISNALTDNNKVVYGRNTEIKEVDITDVRIFENAYHLQGYANSSINLGCYNNEELVGLMTFGKPRFNNNYEYELIRVCWKSGVVVIGGLEKLFQYFLNKYNPTSILTYSDISKFTGNSYLKIGFKPIQPNPITEPNYVWVDKHTNNILTRYQTQKHKLIEQGFGTPDQTEDEIMRKMGFMKIYDSGNIKLEWVKE